MVSLVNVFLPLNVITFEMSHLLKDTKKGTVYYLVNAITFSQTQIDYIK